MLETKAVFQLVVVGSSAGGIEALSILVASLPTPFEVPMVIAQHLDPKRLSHLAEILRRHTALTVVSVEREELLKPNTIYVVPSNHHVEITDHDVKLLPDGDGRPTPSVNLLLTSAAEVYNEKLIAVILTGTGSDGTAGARTVHERGGTVIIQNPQTAAYPGMPESLEPETVDFVADLADIGSILAELINGKAPGLPQIHTQQDLQPFLTQVHEQTGIDFSTYKPATILRRLQRRMVATDTQNLPDYSEYLKVNPDEYDLLVADFLIKVTEFMRDPELFTYLREQILPKLIEYSRLTKNKELRFWSAGCATGEEAYSLAILLFELLGQELTRFNIKIFATDLDSDAIAFARRGFFTTKSLAKLPPQLVERYFVASPKGMGYEVKKQVRNLVVFGEHDLSQRAPFPRIDIVLCRNVLIYFNRELQEHALQLFAFALRDEGYLVLGRTETVSPLAAFFDEVDAHQRVYLRQGVRRLNPPFSLKNDKSTSLPLPHAKPNGAQKPRLPVVERGLFQMQEEARHNRLSRDNLLLKLPVGVVVVDSHFDIVEINAAARRQLSIHTVAIGEDFVHLIQNIPPREIGAAITSAIRENTVSHMEPVEVPHLTTGEATFLQLSCYPQPGADLIEHTGGVISKNEGQGQGQGQKVLIIVSDLTREVTAQRQLKQDNIHQQELAGELNQRILSLEQTNIDLQSDKTQLEQELSELKTTELNHLRQELERITTEQAAAKEQQAEVALAHTSQMEKLVKVNRDLLAANEEVTSQNAALRTDNEEFIMHAEEAQAAIEEADTLNEEMQATNEELETLNEELQATVEELNNTNSDLVVQGEDLSTMAEELRVQQQHSERDKAQLEAILANMADALVVVDSHGEVLLTNAAYQDLLRTTTDKLVLLDEEGEKPLQAENTPLALAARGEAFNLVFNFRDAKGRRHWLEATGQPVRGEDMEDRGVVVLRNITERSLRHLQEQFLSLVGHELRTPLTVVKGYSHLIGRWFGKQEGDFEMPLSYLAQVLTNVATLQHLIEDLVDINRLQNGKFNITFEPVRLDTLLAQVVENSQLLTTIPIEVEPPSTSSGEDEDEPIWVKGDAVRLQQVFTNLINNAITHAPTSPKLCLSLRRVVGSDHAEIRVQDFGAGIKAGHLAEVFNQFYQVTQGELAKSRGLGVGLFICQQIVQAHGGTIRVESIEGEGATFIVQLPLEKVEALVLPN